MTGNDFRELCNRKFLVLDGATGTELAKHGMPAGVCPEKWVCDHPQSICDIHNAYIAAGSDIVYAPTFGGNRLKLAEFGLDGELFEIVSTLCRTAKNNAGNRALVFGDIAPTGRFVEPFGDLPFEDAVAIFKEAALAMLDGGVDGFAIETMMDLQEARAALLGVREAAPGLPVIVTMTFDASGRTLTGSTPEAALITLQALGADAFGCNCSTGPQEMAAVIGRLKQFARIPLVAKPNAGLPKLENGKTVFSMDAGKFASFAADLTSAGAVILGGCCGTAPEYIASLSSALQKIPFTAPCFAPGGVVSSAAEICEFGKRFTIIGERINPTGKKALQAELREGKLDMVMDFAIQQQAAGAQLLDVNMGLSGINETEMMRKAVCRLVRSITLPLCIDSTDPETVEAALRIYPGRALLNSISAENGRIEAIMPIAARYGAMFVALPLTSDGISDDPQERMAVADKIIAAAAGYGYTPADIVVDAMIMAVAVDPQAAVAALGVVRCCQERNLRTVCGLSNISRRAADRKLLNLTFLGMLTGQGLSAAIADPQEIMPTVKAAEALLGKDAQMLDYTAFATNADLAGQIPLDELPPPEAVRECVLRCDSDRIIKYIDLALANGSAPELLLNEALIPAITTVGEKYEKKEFFLNQLTGAAEAMSRGAEYLESMLTAADNGGKQKIKFILATVKGDIHDIGKNIVGVVLKNYGFEVIDLGKDVPPEVIIDTAVAQNVKLIGLSALMTTTMKAMGETVALAKSRNLHDLHFIVGGAVVDADFAAEIGAVYAADPMGTVNAANKLTGL